MNFNEQVERLYQKAIEEFTNTEEFQEIERGTASKRGYDRLISNVVRTHLRSPQLLAFLFSLAPPATQGDLMHNMLEELGIDEESGESHPALLREMIGDCGLGVALPQLEADASESLRRSIAEPLMYGSLREAGLAAWVEVEAFEYMLSRVASRIARALVAHRGFSNRAVKWFIHHSEVDIAHAQQGLKALESYIEYYGFDGEEAGTIAEIAMRENVFVKRYFGEDSLGRLVERSAR